jgi:predicted molibdopterin-dependent oxidoreductase YjgC
MWGMGVTQFGQAVDVVKGLSSLALLTGNLGRPAVGVGPVRGQNNVQGACDMGVLPNMFPGYQDVTDPDVRQKFADAWGSMPARWTIASEHALPKCLISHLKARSKPITSWGRSASD